MVAGQVNWIGPGGAGDQRVPRDSSANMDSRKAAFALVFEAILELSEEQCSETGTSESWLDADTHGSLFGGNGSSGLSAAFTMRSGDGELTLSSAGPHSSESSMGRIIAQGRETQGVSTLPRSGESSPLVVDTILRDSRNTGQPVDPNESLVHSPNSTKVLNKSQLADWMDAHALSRSSSHCAMYVRLGMEAAGINTGDRPPSGDAGDYGPFLLRHGAQTVPPDSYDPQVGDVVVFDKTPQHPYGHIEMYDGHQWVSDFMQNSFSPYSNALSTPPFTIYRLA